MAEYEVLRPIEYNGKLHLPKSGEALPASAKSAGNGREIPVDATGVIDLDPKAAAAFDLGQVKLITDNTKARVKDKEKR